MFLVAQNIPWVSSAHTWYIYFACLLCVSNVSLNCLLALLAFVWLFFKKVSRNFGEICVCKGWNTSYVVMPAPHIVRLRTWGQRKWSANFKFSSLEWWRGSVDAFFTSCKQCFELLRVPKFSWGQKETKLVKLLLFCMRVKWVFFLKLLEIVFFYWGPPCKNGVCKAKTETEANVVSQ